MFKSSLMATVALMMAVTGPAMAAEKPEVAPPEGWVKPSPRTPEPMSASAGAALASLIQDTQFRFQSEGYAFYQHAEIKIQTAQGLQALATLGLSWSPETDQILVHHVRILRGGQVIDILPKDGTFTIARREEKLDSEGRLDGVLTAILKVEGLEVGDIIDMAYTIHRNDPLFRSRVDEVTSIEDVLPITYSRIRMSWPEDEPSRWRVSGGMADPQVTREGGFITAEIISNDVTPQIKPQGAPARFQRSRQFSLSNYSDWGSVSTAMAPLFADATKLKTDSPLAAQARAIADKTQDPTLRAAAALALVQDKIRYLAQTLGEGGYKPAAADDTWARRYGDCKAKTAMLLALLNALGIQAEPVLVSTILGDDLDQRLPSLAVFNHVFVRATIAGRDYWLDGTRAGDLSLAALSIPNYGYVLPVRASGAVLTRLVPPPFDRPQTSAVIQLDASKGLSTPAAAHIEMTFRGDAATVMRLTIANLTPADLDRAMRDYGHATYEAVTVMKSKAEYDPKTGEERLIFDGEAKLDWSGGYEPDGAGVGWKLDPVRDPAAVHPDAPFALIYPFYTETEETIVLPDHGAGFKLEGDAVDQHLAGYVFTRNAKLENGVFHMRTSARALEPEISYAQAKIDAEPLTALSKTTLRLSAPKQTTLSNQDLKTLEANAPSTAGGYLERGDIYFDDRRYKQALSDFDHAVQLDPQSARALGLRALAHFWLGESKAALGDADLAEQLDPREVTIYRARGLIAQQEGNWPEAISNFTRSIDLLPEAFGFHHRAEAYIGAKDYPRALRDMDAELKLEPTDLQPHAAKAAAYISMKDFEKARLELDAFKSAAADNDELRASRLSLLVALGDRKEARVEADAAIAAHPTATVYLQRIRTRLPDDLAGDESDAAAAAAADPRNAMALRYMVYYRALAKDYKGAALWADKAVALDPSDPNSQLSRAAIRQKLGLVDGARADFASVRAEVKNNWAALNQLCYAQAKENFDLPQALADCDASLTLNKTAATLDSRGFVLLRLGRNQEAKAAFDEALILSPTAADSLYGRSLVERRLGDLSAAERDKAAALSQNAKIEHIFSSYGVDR